MSFQMPTLRIKTRLSALLLASFLLALILPIESPAQTGPTTIQITGAVQQASVNRLGVNLSDETYWDSGQMMKNLVFENPGFEGLKYRVIFHCTTVTANSCQDDNQFNAQPVNFWTGGSYLVLSGNSAGMTGTVLSNTVSGTCAGCGPTLVFNQNVNLAVGDYFSVVTYIPGSGDAGWGDNISGGGTVSTETTDLSPETPGKQALLLTASGAGQSAGVTAGFDTWNGLSFIQLNGAFAITFRAKGVGGNNNLKVSAQRLEGSNPAYISQTVALTSAWQDYTLTFSASETGSSVGPVLLAFSATGANVELDDVSMAQTNSSASNPTVFRDDVVNALKELNPGTIRMMAAGAALGSDIPNQLQVPFARYREGFNADGTTYADISYGIHEFLQLCQTVGADPWITIPTATTPTEMQDFIEYLTGTGSDPWSALRIARGQVEPWTTVFGKIHVELGNETWNGAFKGETMNYPAYPQWANQVFGAARTTNGFVANKFDLILSGLASSPGYNAPMLTYSTQHDSFDIAPYLLFTANNEAQATMFGALFAEPEIFESTGGEVYQNMQVGAAAPSATSSTTNVNVYETNLGTMGGNITEAQLNALTPSIGAGIGATNHMLQMMRIGVKYQNAFALPQFEFLRSDQSLVRLWGIVVDMGTTNRRRPQYQTQAMANAVIGGNMLQTVQTGANPTWNQPLSSDNVQLNGAHYLQSFAFLNGTTSSAVLFNLNQTSALPVVFAGENSPTGNVQMTQITSANITDNNETSAVVEPVTQTLSGFAPANGLTLPPFSMTVLTWTSTFAQAPNFSVPAGTYSTSQTVSLSSTTAGATIYYTTNGTTPTANSTLYSGPIAVNATETINAISVAANLAVSPVATAAYVIQPVAAAPVFSVPTGTYNAGQVVVITDVVPGATIYYTTNGSTPTSSSAVYSGAISVSTNETLSAMAAAPNYTNSAVSVAVFTIAPPTVAPVLSVAAGTYQSTQYVQMSDATSGAAIYYTTDGTTPTVNSTRSMSGVAVSTTETVKAIAQAPGYSASPVVSVLYTIAPYVATPVMSVPGGTYNVPQTVALSDSTVGASIYYTTNGTTPTTSSTPYSGPISISKCDYLEAIAVAPGYTQSFVATANYNMTVGTPQFSVAGGTYAGAQTVVISEVTPGAAIFYTTNGSSPSTSSTQYTGPITVSSSETVQAIAAEMNYVNSATGSAAYVITKGTVATPVFSVAAGAYTSVQTVSISDATAGSTIYYTTNGSTPTTSSTVYAGPITVGATETVNAIAIATGYSSSPVASAAYTINLPAATPSFSVAAGTYTSVQTVSISDATAGSTIYYTTNGSTPTTSSTVYAGPITVGATETVNAIAIATGYSSSAVASAAYTINLPAAMPSFSVAAGTYTSVQTVSISDATAGSTIYYTTNGSTPTTSSTVYAGPITVGATETVNAIAIATGYSSSAVASAAYTINLPAAMPSFSVAAGTYTSVQTVSISDATAGSTIYYTTNGSTPTTSSTVYAGPITVGATETVNAIAIATGYSSSAVASAAYTINLPAAMPSFSVAAGTYTSVQTVSISDATAGSTIYYTTNGSTPTTSSTVYAGPITVGATETVNAIAIATGYSSSPVASAAYTINLPAATPSFSVAAGTYTSVQTVSISDATAGSTIYYTTNGSTPTTSSTVYAGPITVGATETVNAIAIATGYSSSAMASAAYTINLPAATPSFSIATGTYTSVQAITISDATAGATIYYTTNGSTPTTSSTVYAGQITVGATGTLNAIAVATGYSSSAVASAAYVINLPAAMPSFSLAAGAYNGGQTVTLSDATAGATIFYTTDGSIPTSSSSVYSSPLSVSASETLTAIAVGTNGVASPVASASYVITPVYSVDLPTGFATKQLDLDGYAALVSGALQLTNGGTAQAGSGWFPTKLTVNEFTTDFDFQLPTSTADGFTFTIQNGSHGLSSIGGNGSGLGYQFITNSVAVAFNLYESGVTNAESVGVYTGGVSPQGNAVNLIGTGINLHSGDPFHVHIVYAGTTLTLTLTDKTTGSAVIETFTVNIPSSVGGSTAYAGFTASTGASTATQNILDWTFSN